MKVNSESKHDPGIQLCVRIYDMRDFRDADQKYFCSGRIFAYFYQPQLFSYLQSKNINRIETKQLPPSLQSLIPTIWIVNEAANESANETYLQHLSINTSNNSDQVTLQIKFCGYWSHCFDLKNFPYDLQILMLNIKLGDDKDSKYRLLFTDDIEDEVYGFSKGNNIYMASQTYETPEWTVYAPRIDDKDAYGFPSILNFGIPVKRIEKYYESTHLFYHFTLTSCCIFTFPGELDGGSYLSRIECTFALLLTTIALQITHEGDLPQVPYSTRLSRYIRSCFYFIMFACFLNFVAYKCQQVEPKTTDAVQIAVPTVWTIFWLIYNYHYYSAVRKFMAEMSKEAGTSIDGVQETALEWMKTKQKIEVNLNQNSPSSKYPTFCSHQLINFSTMNTLNNNKNGIPTRLSIPESPINTPLLNQTQFVTENQINIPSTSHDEKGRKKKVSMMVEKIVDEHTTISIQKTHPNLINCVIATEL